MDQTRGAETTDAQGRRRQLTTFGKITLAALLALVMLFVFQQVVIFKAFFHRSESFRRRSPCSSRVSWSPAGAGRRRSARSGVVYWSSVASR